MLAKPNAPETPGTLCAELLAWRAVPVMSEAGKSYIGIPFFPSIPPGSKLGQLSAIDQMANCL